MQTTEVKLNQIICGDSKDKLKEFSDNMFSGVVTDPPYELNFMGKDWDASGISYSIEFWKEVLRVMKPGAHLLCFGGTRTYHRMACAIEDAGFQIRDSISWIYGEGFPKSTNISKQLDKEVGAEREVVGKKQFADGTYQRATARAGIYSEQKGQALETAPATELAKRWSGYGTGIKPAHEPILLCQKPLEKGLTYAQNAKKWGVVGLNIDSGRIATTSVDKSQDRIMNHKADGKDKGWGMSAKGDVQVLDLQKGRWPANVILSHSPDCVCVGTKVVNESAPEGGYFYRNKEYKVEGFIKDNKPEAASNRGQETVEVWACVPDCPIRIMDEQSGKMKAGKAKSYLVENTKSSWKNSSKYIRVSGFGDSGGASRFFYCAKAKRSEREAGLQGFVECVKCGKFDSKTHTIKGKKEKCIRNIHPTVKPLNLMKYLCTLLKMPNKEQVILDPFCGSGTTLVACEQLGINYIGIDSNMDSVLTSMNRIGVV